MSAELKTETTRTRFVMNRLLEMSHIPTNAKRDTVYNARNDERWTGELEADRSTRHSHRSRFVFCRNKDKIEGH